MCIYTISTYNNLVKLRENTTNAWSQIDVQLKKRFDLVPNLVETVKGYAKHEQETLDKVVSARASVGGAKTTAESIEANKELSSAISRLLVVAERYPELKANTNFLNLQSELKELESKIAFSRQSYNDTVLLYNRKKKSFPANIIAKIFKFEDATYFQVEEAHREAPQVKF